MWHVSSRNGVATLRTAIHLLLTYLHAERSVVYVLGTPVSAAKTDEPIAVWESRLMRPKEPCIRWRRGARLSKLFKVFRIGLSATQNRRRQKT